MKNFPLLMAILIWKVALQAQSCLPGGITFLQQSEVDAFLSQYPDCEVIEGSVYIPNTDILNLDSLKNVKQILGDLLITGNQNLLSLQGLSQLEKVGQALRIQNNGQLTTLNGLQNLAVVQGDFFYIGSNSALQDLEALASLDSVAGIFQIWDNAVLTSLSGLDALNYVGQQLAVFNCPNLADFDGLEGLNHIGGDLRIEMNAVLNEIAALNHPISILGALVITDNPSLSNCAVTSICSYLTTPASFVAITNNATACSSIGDVEIACLTPATDADPYDRTIFLAPNPTTGMVRILGDAPLPDRVCIRDIAGRIVGEWSLTADILDLQMLNNGIYWIEWTNESEIYQSPVVKW